MFYGLLYHEDQNRLKELNRSMILVYSALVSHGGKNRTYTGSQKKLADISGVSLGSVKRALTHFKNQGWLIVSDYYQIKKYELTLVQSLEPCIVQSLDLPTNETVDHSLEPPLVHSLDLPMDQSPDLHVKKNSKEIINIHDMTKEEQQFQNFFQRWESLKRWKMDRPWKDYKQLCLNTPKVDHYLELQIVDSWLMKQHHLNNGRCWGVGWFDRLSSWFHRENNQGGRKGLNLNREQRYFLNYAVTDTSIDTPPVFETDNLAVKVESIERTPQLELVEDTTQDQDPMTKMIEDSKTNPILHKILKQKGIL